MMENHIDALLCPPQVLITPKHHIPAKLFSAVCYTALFNLLDFGAECASKGYDGRLEQD
ncbi:hypothetical protein COOONC_13684 [Cooperia oncophora]